METLGKSVFLELMGDSPLNSLLDFLAVYDQFDYSLMDISKNAGISYSTLKLLIPEMLKKKIIIVTRISGKSRMFRLNKDSAAVRAFKKFYWEITNSTVIET